MDVMPIPHKEECITVVIPTMLKTSKSVFEYTLNQLNSSDLVKRIVIIDNTDNKDFDKQYTITPKFIVLKAPGNLGPGYNSGMVYCDTKYFLLMNDDILCHKTVLDDCYNVIESDPSIGLLQMRTINHQPLLDYVQFFTSEQRPFSTYSISARPRETMTGWFQFGYKRDWIDTPSELKYFYGDDLVLVNMAYRGLKVVLVTSTHISHMTSTTVNATGIRQELHKELAAFERIVQQLFPSR